MITLSEILNHLIEFKNTFKTIQKSGKKIVFQRSNKIKKMQIIKFLKLIIPDRMLLNITKTLISVNTKLILTPFT